MSEERELTFEEQIMYLASFGDIRVHYDKHQQVFCVKAECFELLNGFSTYHEAQAPICNSEAMAKGMRESLHACVDSIMQEWKRRDDVHTALINSLEG